MPFDAAMPEATLIRAVWPSNSSTAWLEVLSSNMLYPKDVLIKSTPKESACSAATIQCSSSRRRSWVTSSVM